jgi:hypothetical protein
VYGVDFVDGSVFAGGSVLDARCGDPSSKADSGVIRHSISDIDNSMSFPLPVCRHESSCHGGLANASSVVLRRDSPQKRQ